MSNQLVALTPQDVPVAQAKLKDWCREKLREVTETLSDLKDSLRIAQSNNWQTQSLSRAVTKTAARITYYEKIIAAVEEGYLVVPNFDVEIMAVRVQRERPRSRSDSYASEKVTQATPELLPPGEGRYVDDENAYRGGSYQEADASGKMVTHKYFCVNDYREVDFPVLAVHPAVMDATARAMSLKLFDEIGVATGPKRRIARHADPFVIGRLIDPRSTTYNQRVLSFFIAWWFDPRVL